MLSPGKNVLRVGHGNFYFKNRRPAQAVQVMRSTHSHSFGGNECVNVVDRLSNLTGYHELKPFGFADQRDAKDCITVVRKSLAVKHFSMTQVCRDTDPRKLAKDRVFSMVTYQHPAVGPVCHINIHPNPINFIRNDEAEPDIVDQFVRSMRNLDRMIKFSLMMGWHPVVTGDYNLDVVNAKQRSYLNMYDLFAKYDMSYRTKHIDGIAWCNHLKLKRLHVITGDRTGSDHPWLIADLVRR